MEDVIEKPSRAWDDMSSHAEIARAQHHINFDFYGALSDEFPLAAEIDPNGKSINLFNEEGDSLGTIGVDARDINAPLARAIARAYILGHGVGEDSGDFKAKRTMRDALGL